MNITFHDIAFIMQSNSISAKVSKMSCQGYKGYKWQCLTTQSPTQQHSHPHNNTVTCNKIVCADQVTVPHPPLGKDKGWGRTRGGGYLESLSR